MKKFLIAAFCISLFGSVTFANANVITPEEAKTILQEIDSVCGDTWCEGDFGFRFHEFSCYSYRGAATCDLYFEMLWTDYVESGDPNMEITASRAYPVSCSISGLKREDIVESMGDRITVAESLYRKVTDCIGRLEDHLLKLEEKIGADS